MPHCLSVGTSKYHGDLRNYMTNEIELLRHQGIGVNLEERKNGSYVIWDIDLSELAQNSFFNEQLASTLAKGVIKFWEEDLLKQILRQHYYYFTLEERKQILNIAQDILHHVNRETFLSQEFLNYLTSNSNLNLEGFLRFRVQQYWHDLEETIDDAVDDYMLEKEYNEFIKLLQYFVEIQEPKLDKIHVVLSSSGEFELYDSKRVKIDNHFFEGLIVELVDSDLSFEDLLISSLINIAPKEITLHQIQQKHQGNAVSTIKKIFSDKVHHCPGCQLCAVAPGKKD